MCVKHENQKGKRVLSNKFFLLVVFIVIGLIGLYIYKFGFKLLDTPERWGALGDYFGGILNPIIALFSLVLLLSTLRQNQEALEYNAEELQLTRIELSNSSIALRDQADLLRKQTFEGTFFQLLSLHQDLTNSIDLFSVDSGQTTRGKDCFKVFFSRFERITLKYDQPTYQGIEAFHLGESEKKRKLEILVQDLNHIRKSYKKFMIEHDSELAHYFKSLLNIIQFVDDTYVSDKKVYFNTIRSQLSTYEIALLFYNGILENNLSNKYKSYIESYTLFKDFDKSILLDEKTHQYFYNKSAFEEIKELDPGF